MGEKKYYFCKVCDEEINARKVRRQSLKSSEKLFWGILIIAMIAVGVGIGIGFGNIIGPIIGLIIGIGPFLLYYFGAKRRQYCPDCGAKLEVSDKPFVEEEIEPRTAREKVLKKAGQKITKKKGEKEKKEEVEKPKKEKEEKVKKEVKEFPEDIFCPFCGAKMKSNQKKCPSCGTKLEKR